MKKRTSSRLERLASLVNILAEHDNHSPIVPKNWTYRRVDSRFYAELKEYRTAIVKKERNDSGYSLQYEELVEFLEHIKEGMQKEIESLTKRTEEVTDFLDGEL